MADRQIAGQRARQTDWKAGRQGFVQADMWMETGLDGPQTERWIDGPMDAWIDRSIHRQTNVRMDLRIVIQANEWTDREMDRHVDRQTDR